MTMTFIICFLAASASFSVSVYTFRSGFVYLSVLNAMFGVLNMASVIKEVIA